MWLSKPKIFTYWHCIEKVCLTLMDGIKRTLTAINTKKTTKSKKWAKDLSILFAKEVYR